MDLILVNGTVMTQDPARPRAEAVAVADGWVRATGPNTEIERSATPRTRVIDLAGRTVIPGLVDAHVHLATDAASSDQVDVRDLFVEVRSVADLLGRLAAAAAETTPGTWIAARGSPMQGLRHAEGRLPTRAELDTAVPANPVWVTFGAHVLVANSAAIDARGIDAATPDPDRGLIERDPATGSATGVFFERAGTLIKGRQDRPAGWLEDAIVRELERCVARGVTTVHDVVAEPAELAAYQRLRAERRLPARVSILVRAVQSGFAGMSHDQWGLPIDSADPWLWFGGVKMSVDGGFTGGNAVFSEPIEGRAGRALTRITQDELDAHVAAFDAAGIRVAVHAMGDVALDMALDAFARRAATADIRGRRHRIEHMGNWCATDERLERAKALGLTPVPNPSMAYNLDRQIEADLGPGRWAGAFDFERIADLGLPLVTGSDGPGYWPIDVLRDIGLMTDRATRLGRLPGQAGRIGFEDAIRAQTATAAWLGFREHDLGSVVPGKRADLIVLGEDASHDVASPAAQPAAGRPVDMTIVDGRVVFERAS